MCSAVILELGVGPLEEGRRAVGYQNGVAEGIWTSRRLWKQK